MNHFFITLGLTSLPKNMQAIMATTLFLIFGIIILIYFSETTLFLSALLISVIAMRAINAHEQTSGIHNDDIIMIDKSAGIWFALSVAPAINVSIDEIGQFSNGFLIQSMLSFALFIYFEKSKLSIIGKIYREAKSGLSTIGDDIFAGFTAGIISSLLWQTYLRLLNL